MYFERTFLNQYSMKFLSSILFILVFSIAGYAQENTNKSENNLFNEEKPKQRYELFETSPKLKFPNPDGLVFSDSIRSLPGKVPIAIRPENDLTAYFSMPVAEPGDAFSSNMPVMVPDSSVHYYILQKRIRINRTQPNAKN